MAALLLNITQSAHSGPVPQDGSPESSNSWMSSLSDDAGESQVANESSEGSHHQHSLFSRLFPETSSQGSQDESRAVAEVESRVNDVSFTRRLPPGERHKILAHCV